MAAVAATTLPFFLISLLVLFISCSHIIYCFAIATSTLEGQGLVPSSVTPKAAAVHYWHLKIHSNKPVPPIFLSKLSPFSPSEMITTNVEAMSAMSNKERPYDKYASQERPYDKYASEERPYDKYASQGRPYDKYASEERPYDKYASRGRPYDKYASEERPYDKYASEGRPYDKYASQGRPYDKYASEERPYDKYASQERPYDKYAAQERPYDKYASEERRPYDKYASEERRPYDKYAAQERPYDKYASGERRPYDKYASEERPYDKYAAQERPYDKYASEERRPYDKYATQERPYDKYASGERRPYDKYASEERPYGKYAAQERPYDKYASEERRPYDKYASEERPYDKYASEERPYDKYASEERPYDKYASEERPYDKYASRDRHATASNDAKRATKHYNFNSHNNIKMATGDEVKEKTAEQNDPQGIFFRESDLKEGKTIPSLKFAGRGSGQYFLPRSIASKIPFYVSTVSKIFNIPTDSAMYRAIENAMSHCKMPPNTGETSQCVTSAEDMTDYAVSTLGANTDIKVWSTHNSSGFGGKGLIGKVKVVYDGELMAKQHLACHQVTFPYLVYHCHTVSNTRVYDMEILDVETKEKINQGVALCHLDTSAWNSDHMSFAALGTTPGMTEVCHWIHPWDMTWTAGDVAE